jgi:hypothetical protein
LVVYQDHVISCPNDVSLFVIQTVPVDMFDGTNCMAVNYLHVKCFL